MIRPMLRRAAQLRETWPFLAFIAALAALGVAHAAERFAHLNPCALCLHQRDGYWGIAGIGAAGFLALRAWPGVTLARAAAVLLGLGFLTGALVAGYHVAVEHHWLQARCDAVDINQIRAFNVNGTFQAPNCEDVQWS